MPAWGWEEAFVLLTAVSLTRCRGQRLAVTALFPSHQGWVLPLSPSSLRCRRPLPAAARGRGWWSSGGFILPSWL